MMKDSQSSDSAERTEVGIYEFFRKIANSKNAFFRSQQRNEPELTETEKIEIVTNLFKEKRVVFLTRYANFMSKDDVKWFRDSDGELAATDTLLSPSNSSTNHSDEIEFYLNKLEHSTEKSRKNEIKNRRYAYMRNNLLKTSDYFSDYEMRRRQPLLYDRMIGRYQTENEMRTAFHTGPHQQESTWSGVLLNLQDSKETSEKKYREKMVEKMTTIKCTDSDHSNSSSDFDEETASFKVPKITDEEKHNLREMFLHEMYETFLNGQDEEFDYSEVDTNADYDMIDVQEVDQQEKYFDED